MSGSIPQYSLKQVTRNQADKFQILQLKGDTDRIPSIFLQPHRKDYYVLMLVQQGSSRHWTDMIPYTLRPDTFYFSTPNQLHLQEETQPLYGKILSFTKEFLLTDSDQSLPQLPVVRNLFDAHEILLDEKQAKYVDMLMNELLIEYLERNEWREMMLHTKLKTLLVYLSRMYVNLFAGANASKDRALLHQYRDLINQDHARVHDVASYANKLNISPGHLGKVIRQQTGKSAIEYIHERLILEAKRLLFHTEQTMKEIAFELGFEEASHFNRFFKKLTGKTPLVYRNETRQQYS